jgi:hypothetical protein
VALDPAGGTHAINKAVTGLTATHVRQRLADLDRDALPSVETARAEQRRQPEPAPAPTLELDQAPTPHSEPQEQTPPAQQAEPEPLQSQVAGGSPSVEEPHGSVEEEAHKSQCNAPTEQAASAQGPLDDPPEATPEAMENTRPAAASRSPEPSRLRQVLDRARKRLDALGERLEAAFLRVRDTFKRHAVHQEDPEIAPNEEQGVSAPQQPEGPREEMQRENDELEAQKAKARQEQGKRLLRQFAKDYRKSLDWENSLD